MSLNFHTIMNAFPSVDGAVAVGVSGGPDSMALCYFLSRWADDKGVEVHALSVDHDLREGAAAEAVQVGQWISTWGNVQHHILKWEHDGQDARVQEEARNARYDLMAEYCRAQGIDALFAGHHTDDQAETVLFRLAKGSGLDGLAGMSPVHDLGGGVRLYRPFLELPKAEILKACDENDVPYIEDPSNKNDDFARVRLRESREVLEKEGLTNKRLAVTAKRLARARMALESLADDAYAACASDKDSKRIEFNLNTLRNNPEEIVLRCILKGINELSPSGGYGPRFEKVESLCTDLLNEQSFRKRTLGGVVFEVANGGAQLVLTAEHP